MSESSFHVSQGQMMGLTDTIISKVNAIGTRTIYGNGRPDIPATLTTPGTPAAVASATNGTAFVSLNGPMGAWEWRRRGSSWVVTNGLTPPLAVNTFTAGAVTGQPLSASFGANATATGGITVIRTTDTVVVTVNGLERLANEVYVHTSYALPIGYRPQLSEYASPITSESKQASFGVLANGRMVRNVGALGGATGILAGFSMTMVAAPGWPA